MSDFGEETKKRYPALNSMLTMFYQCRNDDLLDPIAAIDEGVDNAGGRGREAAGESVSCLPTNRSSWVSAAD